MQEAIYIYIYMHTRDVYVYVGARTQLTQPEQNNLAMV